MKKEGVLRTFNFSQNTLQKSVNGMSSRNSLQVYFTASASSAPALNLMTFFAGISIFSLVAGLMP